MSAVRGVLLDVDDTILDTRSAMLSASSAAMSAVWPSLTAGQRAAAAGAFYVDPERHFAAYTRGETTFEAMRQGRLRVAAAQTGLSEPPVAALPDYEAAFRPAFEAAQYVFEDALPFVAACRTAGLPVGALTNSSGAMTAAKFAVLGLSDLFDMVVTRDTLGYGKPAAGVFHHACSLLGTTPQETVYVGDEYEVDVVGAAGAGMIPVWLRRRGQPDAWATGAGSHAVAVRDLGELWPLLGVAPDDLGPDPVTG